MSHDQIDMMIKAIEAALGISRDETAIQAWSEWSAAAFAGEWK